MRVQRDALGRAIRKAVPDTRIDLPRANAQREKESK